MGRQIPGTSEAAGASGVLGFNSKSTGIGVAGRIPSGTGNPHVTAYGDGADHCKLGSWYQSPAGTS